ncbi:MAG: DUF2059 domain-containing protein [Pseudomonadota bacterium]
MFVRFMLAASVSLLSVSVPALAQDQDEETVEFSEEADASSDAETFEFLTEEEEELAAIQAELTEEFALLGEIFKPEPLTQEQEALLPKAQSMANVIMPEGTLSLALREMMDSMFDIITAAATEDPRTRLSEVSGVELDELSELDDEAAQEALDIFDPQFAERTDQSMVFIVDMMGELFAALEPSYRDAYARALTKRFGDEEMYELLTFFSTPLGEKFAVESFAIQYDPQMLGVMEQMGPAFAEVLPGILEDAEALDAVFEDERNFSDLSEAERARASGLLGKSVRELDALQLETQDVSDEDEDDGLA